MKNTSTINAKLYAHLLEAADSYGVDGDSLIAFYLMCKASKTLKNTIAPIVTKNGRRIVKNRLLMKVTGFSAVTVGKFVPILAKEELMVISSDGGWSFLSNDSTNDRFKSRKIIKIQMGTFREVKLSVYNVRIVFAEKQQLRAIMRTSEQINIIERFQKNLRLDKKQLRVFKKLEKVGYSLDNLKNSHKSVSLSNEGFYNLKKGIKDKKACGKYWKNKLSSAGKITVSRQYIRLKKCTKQEYLCIKSYTKNKRLCYYGSYLLEETVNRFETNNPFLLVG